MRHVSLTSCCPEVYVLLVPPPCMAVPGINGASVTQRWHGSMLQPHRPKATAAKVAHRHSQRRTLYLPGLTSCCRAPGLDLTCSRNYMVRKQGLPIGETWQESAVRATRGGLQDPLARGVEGEILHKSIVQGAGVRCRPAKELSHGVHDEGTCPIKASRHSETSSTPSRCMCCLDGWSCCWCCSAHHTPGSSSGAGRCMHNMLIFI